MTYQRATNLICSCCGKTTRGRQWFNRDRGYGLCYRCLHDLKHSKDALNNPEYIQETYGIEGYHFNLKGDK